MNPSYQSFATHDESEYPELWDGCIGAWAPCLGPSGTRLHDNSGRGNWGTLTNMDAATDWTVSQGNYAISFDSSNDFISIDSSARFLRSGVPFTLSWWEKVEANTNAFPARFRLASATNTFAVITTNGATPYAPLAWGEWRGVLGCRAQGATKVQDRVGRWTHNAIVGLVGPQSNTPANYRFYENGVNLAVTASEVFSNFSPIVNQIGWDSLDNGANCEMDSVFIYSRVLSADEVRLLASRRGIAYTPRRRRKAYFLGPTFNAAWARGSNVILQPAMGVG